MNKYLGCPPSLTHGTVLKVDESINTKDGPEERICMTMLKALHSRDDINRLHVSRKEEGRRLTNIQDSVNASIQRFENYIEK